MPRVKVKVRRKYRMPSKWTILFSLIIILLCAIVWALFDPRIYGVAQDYVSLSSKALPVTFPRDDGPHEVRTEWWYYTGRLETEQGEVFSYHYTLFAHKAFATYSIIHFSMLDHTTMKSYQFQKRIPGFQVVKVDSYFQLGTPPWQVKLLQSNDELTGQTENLAFKLKLDNQVPAVLQEEDAILDFQAAGQSYYYSRPRMPTEGTITIGDKVHSVSGQTWFDHQWGEFRATVLNWDWFALQLDNGADVMLFSLTDAQGKYIYSGGTLHSKNGTEYLTQDDFQLKPGQIWTSPLTSHTYPIQWTITIPKHNIALNIDAFKSESEFDARKTSYSVYWEGPVKISGSHSGHGFMEINKANVTSTQ